MDETPAPKEQCMEISGGYEQLREERIKENRERMQKLGIYDLSIKLKPLKASKPHIPKKNTPPPPAPAGPARRSSRLQNSAPVSYNEVKWTKKDKPSDSYDDLVRAEGSKPEVYTEEHEKLLGTTEMSWTLFVDGYGSDGKRIYDPVRGKTCHQCRQKTLGHRTHCIKCNMVQGQFCGDCLYMRYGENVLEAKENPNWICPACRGICNCSLCRQAKGWPPTGALYRKILRLGYKSVAHYLIQRRRANAGSDENSGSKVPVSAKKSLPFSEVEVAPRDDDSLSKSNIDNINTDLLLSEVDETAVLKLDCEPVLEPAIVTLSEDHVESEVMPEPKKSVCKTELESTLESMNKEKLANSMTDNKLEECSAELKSKTELESTLESPQNNSFLMDSSNYLKCSSISETNDEIKNGVIVPTTPKSVGLRMQLRRSKRNSRDKAEEMSTPDDNCNMSNGYDGRNAEDVKQKANVDRVAGRLKMRRRA